MRLARISRAAAALVVGLLLFSTPLWAQTVLSSTTLSSAMSDTAGQTMVVASATGFSASTASSQVLALIDRELVAVRTVNSTTIGIVRGANGTRPSSHVSGAVVWVGPPIAFQSYVPAGQCTRTNLLYVPWIVAGDVADASINGQIYDCLGVTTAGQWTQVNALGPQTLGSTVASVAGQITPTGSMFTVSGTNAITGIVAPAGLGIGFTLFITPSGVFTWTAANNIALAGTAVVNKMLMFTWNGTKWVPSYIA